MSSKNTSEMDVDTSTSSINPKTANGIYKGVYHFNIDLNQTQMGDIRKYAQELKRRQLSNKKSDWPKFLEFLEEFSDHFYEVNLDEISKSYKFEGEKSRYGLAFSAILKSFFSPSFLKDFDSKGMSLFGDVNKECSTLNTLEMAAMYKSIMKNVDSWSIDTLVDESHTILYYRSNYKEHINMMLVAKLQVKLQAEFLNEYKEIAKDYYAKVSPKDLLKLLKKFCKTRGINYNQKTDVGETYLMENAAPKKTKKTFCHYCKKNGHLIDQCIHKKKKDEKEEAKEEEDQLNLVEMDVPDEDFIFTKQSLSPIIEKQTTDYGFMASTSAKTYNHVEMVVDSGASLHVVNSEKNLVNIRKKETTVYTVNNKVTCKIVGDLHLKNGLHLKNCVVIPNCKRDLISVAKLVEDGYEVSFKTVKGQTKGVIKKKDKLIVEMDSESNVFFLRNTSIGEVHSAEETTDMAKEIMLGHLKLGHLGAKGLKKKTEYSKYTIKEMKAVLSQCESCQSVVTKKHGSQSVTIVTKHIGERIAADIFGPINEEYGIIARDIHTGYIIAKAMLSKGEASTKLIGMLKVFMNLSKLHGSSVCYVRTDNEFDTKLIAAFCEENGIIHETTAPHSSYMNGSAESTIGHIKQNMKKYVTNSGVQKDLWAYVFLYAVYLMNITPRYNSRKSPYSMITGNADINTEKLLPFGCQIFGYNYKPDQKVFNSSYAGIFVGYEGTLKKALIYVPSEDKVHRTSSFKGMPTVFPIQQRWLNKMFNEEPTPINEKDWFDTTNNKYITEEQNEERVYSGNATLSNNITKPAPTTNESKPDSSQTSDINMDGASSPVYHNLQPNEKFLGDYVTDGGTYAWITEPITNNSHQDNEIVTTCDNLDIVPVSSPKTPTPLTSQFSTALVPNPLEDPDVNMSSSASSSPAAQQKHVPQNQEYILPAPPPRQAITNIPDPTSYSNNSDESMSSSDYDYTPSAETNNEEPISPSDDSMSSSDCEYIPPTINKQTHRGAKRNRESDNNSSDKNTESTDSNYSDDDKYESCIEDERAEDLDDTNYKVPQPENSQNSQISNYNTEELEYESDSPLEYESDEHNDYNSINNPEGTKEGDNDYNTLQDTYDPNDTYEPPELDHNYNNTNDNKDNPPDDNDMDMLSDESNAETENDENHTEILLPHLELVKYDKHMAESNMKSTYIRQLQRERNEKFRVTKPTWQSKSPTKSPTKSSTVSLRPRPIFLRIPDIRPSGGNRHNRNEEANLLVSKNKYVLPETFADVLQSKQKDHWISAMNEELKAISDQKVFVEHNRSKLPPRSLLVKSRWVFNVKSEVDGSEKFKARLVAKGFTQSKGDNYVENYAPVMKDNTMRMMLALAVINKWKIKQMDAKNAFLNGNIDYDTYLIPPPGSNCSKNMVWKLKKGLYGLKQAPLIWYKTLATALTNAKYKVSILEPCVFYTKEKDCIILVYVDDILITGKDEQTVEKAAKCLNDVFVMKDLGTPKVFLGVNLDITNNDLRMNARSSIEKMQQDFEIETPKHKMKTPMTKGFESNFHDKSPPLSTTDHSKYRSIVGTLLFFSKMCRPDISFAVSVLSSNLVTPKMAHLKAAYKVVQYIIQTKERGIRYGDKKVINEFQDFRYLDKTKDAAIKDYNETTDYRITVMTDSSWGNHIEDRRSQGGYIVLLNDLIIGWGSKKIRTIAESTAEAEYMAISEGNKEAIYFRNLLVEIGFNIGYVDLCVDNIAALTLSSHNTQHQKTKHIAIRYHKIRQLVNDKIIKLNYVNTNDNLADIMTKSLNPTTYKNIVGKLIMDYD